jgi:hypothetical protein
LGGGDVGYRGFIGIGGYKKGVSSKNMGLFYWKYVLEGGSTKGFWRYLSISSEIRGIL